MGDGVKVIVKVGKTSHIRLGGVKAFRALTFADVNRLMDKFPETSSVIVESILPYEIDSAIEAVQALRDKGKFVFVHCIDGANIQEREIAEQFSLDISTSLDELQHSISKQIAMNVSTAWARVIDIQETGESLAESLFETITDDMEQTEQSSTTQELEASQGVEQQVEAPAPKERKRDSYMLDEAFAALHTSSESDENKVLDAIISKDDLVAALGLESYDVIDIALSDEESTSFERVSPDDIIESDDSSLSGLRKQGLTDLYRLLEEVTKEKQDISDQLSTAYSRIEQLLDIKTAIEDERDLYQRMLDGIDNTLDVIEDPVPGAQLDEAKQRINDLRQSNISLEQKMLEYSATQKVQDERIARLSGQLDEASETVKDLTQQIEDKERQIASLQVNVGSSETLKLELSSLKSDKAELTRTVSELKTRITSLTKEIDSAATKSSVDDLEKISQLRDDIEALNASISEYRNNEAIENKGRLVLNLMLSDAIHKEHISATELNNQAAQIDELNALVKRLKSSIKSNDIETQQLKARYDELLASVDSSKERYDIEKDEQQAKFTTTINRLQSEIDTSKFEARKLKNELAQANKSLQEKEAELESLIRNSGVEKQSADEAISARKALEDANIALNGTVRMLKNEVGRLTARLSMTEEANVKLESVNKRIRTEMVSMQKAAQSAQTPGAVQGGQKQAPVVFRVRLDCEYHGNAQIIPVFGSGSFGITTMAMSLARKMPKASILYMDMDLTNPKADGWFKKPPFAQLPDIKDPFNRSSFGALLEKGPNYVMGHPELFQNVESNKLGYRLDYFSGVYQRIDPRRLMMVDFSGFITYLGNKYNYIIVDLGRIGSSDSSDELIHMFSSIAPKSLLVTLNNTIDTRSAKIKLMQNNIDAKNIVWVLNMSDNTIVSPQVQKSIGAATPIVMPKELDMVGKMVTFDRVPILKDKLAQIIDVIL